MNKEVALAYEWFPKLVYLATPVMYYNIHQLFSTPSGGRLPAPTSLYITIKMTGSMTV
jgi:hypothetical protein